jgi:peptidoglycan/xylan/chitin deacetylase (PgdA/CDA1 family)
MNLNNVYDLFFTEKRGRFVETSVSTISQMCHLLSFGVKKSKPTFDSAMLIFSVDIDVGSAKLGRLNYGTNDYNVHKCFTEAFIGDIEERALPVFVNTFDSFEIPATFAVRGQIAEVGGGPLEPLLKAQVKHDIGAHGYSHRSFRALSRSEAEEELKRVAIGLGRFGVQPKTFIFPRNLVNHLELLDKFGYKCYRDLSAGLFADSFCIEKRDRLYNIQPSLYLNLTRSPLILKGILDVAIRKKAPIHLWFHLWTFGNRNYDLQKYVKNVFSPFLKYAQNKRRDGFLTFETMFSAAEKADKISIY